MADLDRHIETPIEGMALLQNFLMDNNEPLPDDVKAKLREFIQPSAGSVQSSVEAAELIYARRDELPAALLEIGAQLATMCALYNFHGLGNEGRGAGMAATIRAMDAVASQAPPAAAEAPEPKPEYLPTPPAPEGEEAAPTPPVPPGS